LGVSYDRVEDVARITEKYHEWCQEAGWHPTPDQIVYRGTILLAETDRQADQWLERLKAGLRERGMAVRPSVSRAVQAARAGKEFDPHEVFTGSTQAGSVRDARGLVSFIGGPDTIVKQLKAFHDQCGTGVVDLAFQQPGIDHREVMKEIELFGKEVLPQIKEF
jgi:alkanesulfonate monooxygenase SsuD/methylene tetrahydromethanopterin reductase-like flavin-dependent oxidoreductase (luciferase family)